MTSARSSACATSLAATRWPLWIGSKVPPSTPIRFAPLMIADSSPPGRPPAVQVRSDSGNRFRGGRRMADRSIGIVMNGVTGRLGYRQHLVRSLLAIRDAGGVPLADGSRAQVE